MNNLQTLKICDDVFLIDDSKMKLPQNLETLEINYSADQDMIIA